MLVVVHLDSEFRAGYAAQDHRKKYTSAIDGLNIYLVIGESSRADYYSFCPDYKVDASPLLSGYRNHPNFIAYCDTTAVALSTRFAVTSMLSSAPVNRYYEAYNHKTLITLFNNFGFKTNVYTNNFAYHPDKKFYPDRLVSLSFMGADHFYSYSTRPSTLDRPFIEKIKQEFKKNRQSINIVHLRGNHVKFNKSYPEGYLSHTKVDDYTKSIRYTDETLAYFLSGIETLDEPSLVLYIADHGQYVNDYNDGLYNHGLAMHEKYKAQDKDTSMLYDVPFFAYMNQPLVDRYPEINQCLRKNQHRRLSQDNITPTLLGLLTGDQSYDFHDTDYDLCSADFIEHPRALFLPTYRRSFSERGTIEIID